MKWLFNDVVDTGKTFSLNKSYYNSFLKEKLPKEMTLEFEDDDSFWVPVRGMDEKTKEIKVQGYVRISFSILTKEQ